MSSKKSSVGRFAVLLASAVIVLFFSMNAFAQDAPTGYGGIYQNTIPAAFVDTTFLQRRDGWEYRVPAYIAALLSGLGRVTSREQYLHGDINGSGMGSGTTPFYTKRFENGTLSVAPFGLYGGGGVMLCFSLD